MKGKGSFHMVKKIHARRPLHMVSKSDKNHSIFKDVPRTFTSRRAISRRTARRQFCNVSPKPDGCKLNNKSDNQEAKACKLSIFDLFPETNLNQKNDADKDCYLSEIIKTKDVHLPDDCENHEQTKLIQAVPTFYTSSSSDKDCKPTHNSFKKQSESLFSGKTEKNSHGNSSSFFDSFGFLGITVNKPTTSELLKENCKDELEEDFIIVPDHGKSRNFSYWDIRCCVKNIVSNIMLDETSTEDDLTAIKIAQRMQTLYHQNFTNRLKDIEHALKYAKAKCAHSSDQLKEICPGIRVIDVETLEPGQWLNDVIINKYLALLERSIPWSCSVSSFFYDGLKRHGKHSLPDEWFEKKYLLIPLCSEHHWFLLCASPVCQTIEVYNSLHTSDLAQEQVNEIRDYLQSEFNKEKSIDSLWSVQVLKNLPQQENAYDCGVFLCMFARQILYCLSSNFHQSNVTEFRKWLKKELVANNILS